MNKRNEALAAMEPARQPEPLVVVPASPKPEHKTVANSAARVMLYLPPEAKEKVREIAFYERRKEHDVFIEALRDYFAKRGYPGLL